MAESQLRALAAEITKLADTFASSLEENKMPEARFTPDGPVKHAGLTGEMFVTRQSLSDKLQDIIYNYVHNVIPDAACLNILNHFNFWTAVPLDGSASFEEIAKSVSLPKDVVERVLQHGFTLRLFDQVESDPSQVKHTARSAALAKQSGLRALVSSVLDITGAPMMTLHAALEKYSRGKSALTQEMSETAFALFHSSGPLGAKYVNSWDYLENDGEGDRRGWRQKEFIEFMHYLNDIFQLKGVILNAHDWETAGSSTVVDVGGSAGVDAFMLAKKFPDLKIIVQDLPMVEPVFNADIPEELKGRVSFLAHDMYKPQPTEADIYMMKLVLHDYPESECIKLLRALIPALKPGSRVIIIEYIGKVDEGDAKKEPMPRSIQQMGTATDLRMMALFNAKERPAEAYKGIFKAADARFEVVGQKGEAISFFTAIEAIWRG
ncbi:S-adenosyl-L-methionine-dependent methyltransferase [Xylariaceae sp. FL1272]|nr:S-adenosyl-L-methionine-dependent methyltransferase [Xylariaceae sp. FL1272]